MITLRVIVLKMVLFLFHEIKSFFCLKSFVERFFATLQPIIYQLYFILSYNALF